MEPIRKIAQKPLGIRVVSGAKKMPVVDTDGRFKTKNKKHSTKITKKNNIKDFELDMLYVHVSWHTMPVGQLRQLQLCRQQYEQWLASSGRLDWYMEEHDMVNVLAQVYGTMAIDEYWECAEYDVKCKDLYCYITAKNLFEL